MDRGSILGSCFEELDLSLASSARVVIGEVAVMAVYCLFVRVFGAINAGLAKMERRKKDQRRFQS